MAEEQSDRSPPGIKEVVGSIPSGSTNQFVDIARFSVSLNVPDISETCAPRVHKKSHRD